MEPSSNSTAMTAPGNPRLRIRDGEPADLERLLDIFYDAFDSNVVNRLMMPNGVSASARAKMGESFFPKEPDAAPAGPGPGPDGRWPRHGAQIIKVAELLDPGAPVGQPGEVIAFGRWTWNKVAREQWEWDIDRVSTAEELGEGVNVEVTNAFIGGLKEKEKKHARGDPNLVLTLLATDTKRHRTGAGSALVRWGLDFADEQGLPAYLEASPSGYALYKRLGYEDIDWQDLPIRERWNAADDGTDWGTKSAVEFAGPLPEGCFRSVVMRRPAKRA